MMIKDIADDLAEARAALGEDTWEWFHTLALEGESDCSSCFDGGAYNLWDNGRLSRSTAPAIPFLVRFAVAGVHSSEFFRLVSEIGHGTRDRRSAKAVAAHRAVLDQVPLLLELARTSQDRYVRCHAVRAASCGPASDVLPVVRSLWDDQGLDDGTRAEALRVRLFLEPKKARPVAAEVVKTGSDPLKVLTIAALAASGAKWRPSHGRIFAAAHDGYRRSKVTALDDPLWKTVTALASQDRAQDAARLLVPFLSPKRDRWTRHGALCLAENLVKHRKARAILLPAVLPLLTKRRSAENAVRFLERFGRGDTGVIDAIAALAAAPAAPGSPQALAFLIERADARSTALLTLHVAELATPRLRNDFEWNYQAVFWALREQRPAFDAPLLNAIRTWMRTWPREPDWRDEPGGPRNTVLDLLARWGPAAHEAVPELIDVLPNHYLAVLPTLRAVARTADDHVRIDRHQAQAEEAAAARKATAKAERKRRRTARPKSFPNAFDPDGPWFQDEPNDAGCTTEPPF
ncbi:hypothetical protein [Actinocorallia populi]|uniref:hypothetical protein n=1 Tax=Actinocorallia populi TaxID=2079200 RepID=UPI000D086FB0|nr:hypothetical protein [Actinocorallia populi]